jgi:hypothetical protein
VEQRPAATEPRPTLARWVAAAMLVAAVMVGALGHSLLPQLLVWLLFAMLVWAAGTIWFRTIDLRNGSLDRWRTKPLQRNGSRRLKPGESYERAAKLTWAPNVPLAEAICSHLRANGIEAFYKRVPTFEAVSVGTSDFDPAEVWVAEHQLAPARALL